jgi:integrase
LLFLYEHVLDQALDRVQGVVRAQKPKRVPVALSRDEVVAMFRHLEGVPSVVCMTLYGAGLRLGEGLSLRVKDLDFERREIIVRDGKGAKDRVTMLPDAVREPTANGAGNGSSPRRRTTATGSPGSSTVITCTKRSSRRRCAGPRWPRASRSA